MTSIMNPRARRAALAFARAGAILSLAMIVLSVAQLGADPAAEAVGTRQGAITFRDTSGPITSGGSDPFIVGLPAGAACQGSGSEGYRWETFLVSGSVDPGALTWALGPNPVSGSVVTSMFSADGDAVNSKFPAGNPTGLISNIPQLSFPNTVASLPPGTYEIGIACTFEEETEEYWSTELAVTADPTDSPLGIAWTAQASAATTTTTAATTTTTAAATTTTRPGATTTTVAGATTTTVAGATTTTVAGATTTTVAGATTTAFVASGAGGFSGGGSGGALPRTGTASSWPVVVWGALLLAFGRMSVLMARPVRVLPPKR
jgi:hypothetical protein